MQAGRSALDDGHRQADEPRCGQSMVGISGGVLDSMGTFGDGWAEMGRAWQGPMEASEAQRGPLAVRKAQQGLPKKDRKQAEPWLFLSLALAEP